jgi:uncharacterized protein
VRFRGALRLSVAAVHALRMPVARDKVESMEHASILWNRLETPGHDACELFAVADGWRLEGVAVLSVEGEPARLDYFVEADGSWNTRRGGVSGWIGATPIGIAVARDATGAWTRDGVVVEGLERCYDLDFGFTPATNVLQLRRLDLAEGDSADVPVAWLDLSDWSLGLIEQRYTRKSPTTYWYEAPRFDYSETLEVLPNGFICRYPRLWEVQR